MSLSRLLPWGVLWAAALLGGCDVPAAAPQVGAAEPGLTQTRAPAPARSARDPLSGLSWIEVRELPPEGRQTLRRIASGGPFPYRKDGSVFGNRERLLPRQPPGTYREYTVPTPGESDRGARRIVCADRQPPTAECYYTADHYSSFRRIAPW
ncbi:ribonuclease domain-containing protein [Deinococcus murrayi]|uniref:ribonuclease domain-containing protein n=1 Tax=Deinococcus murrayi TaxID=68910 RepID=UPI0004841283